MRENGDMNAHSPSATKNEILIALAGKTSASCGSKNAVQNNLKVR
jgi:hypothetical protein